MVKAGLAKLNTLATNSMKTTAAKNLSSAQRAANASYGIMAQRSSQSIFNSKLHNSGSMSALRHQLNSRTIVNNYGPVAKKSDSGMDTMGKIMMYGMLGTMAAQMGIGIAGAIKDLKGSSNNGNRIGDNDGKGGVALNNAASGMENAKDSLTLDNEIQKAKARLAKVPAELQSAEGELKELQRQTDGLKTKSDQAANELTQHKKAIEDKQSEITQQTTTVQSCKDSYDSAKSEYDNCPEYISNANGEQIPNPKKEQLKIIMEQKEKLYNDAKTKLEQLEGEKKELVGKTEGYEKAAKEAKEAYDKNVKDVETKESKVKELRTEKEQLEKAIPKQEERLKKLQEQEDKDYAKLTQDILKQAQEVESLKAKGKSDKAAEKQTELDRLKAKQAEDYKKIQLRKAQNDFSNGTQIFKNIVDMAGNRIYAINGREVSQTYYEEALRVAKGE